MKTARDALRLTPDNTGLLVIDIQERLLPAMAESIRESHLQKTCQLIRGFELMGLPVVVTEQYPQGLGPTSSVLREAGLSGEAIPKTEFSCWQNDAAKHHIQSQGRSHWVVVGMETHICVFQTALDLLDHTFSVHVVADATLSRVPLNWERGLELCAAAGAHITTAETVLFQLLGKAGGPAFKEISKLVR